jgi:Tol biopolymer transport system component
MSDGGEHWDRPLEGWKEISAYLKRDESTARRWEREEGLPVHRHEHKERSSVYASRRELEAWRSARRPAATTRTAGERPSFVWTAAAAMALTLVAGGDGFQAVADAGGPGATRTQEVCRGCDWGGSVSPDGRWISETDWRTWNVGLRDLGTEELVLLTGTASARTAFGGPGSHVFSPDGRFLAFDWLTPRSCELRKIRVDERDGKPLLVYSDSDLEEIQARGWSPTGEILVSARREDWSTLLGFVPAGGGELRVVKTLSFAEPSVRLSPDGRWVAYDIPSQAHPPNRDVHLLAADGSRDVLVGGHPANDYAVGFTAGSDALLFESNRTGTYGLWAAEIRPGGAAGEPRLLQRDTGPIVPLSITADGALYYARASGMEDVFTAEVDLRSGSIVSAPKLVAGRIQGSNRGALWSPDGRLLVYRSTAGPIPDLAARFGGGVTLVVRSWPDGEEREVVPEGIEISPYYQMYFSPGGDRLMVSARDTRGRWGIYAVDLETASAELLMQQPPHRQLRSCGWGADGKSWFYVLQSEDGGGAHSIHRMDPAAGKGVRIYSIADRGYFGKIMKPTLSPRRDLIAFRVLGGQEIWVLHIESGEAVKVYESRGGGSPVNPAWTPEGDALLAIVHGSPRSRGEHQRILRIPIDGSPVSEIQPLGDRISDLSVHPDGKTLVYHRYLTDVGIWKMEGYWTGARSRTRE